MLLPKSSRQPNPKKRKAITDLEAVPAEIKAPVHVPAIASLWKRPTQFSGGYANAIPFFEYHLIETSTIPHLNPTIVSLLAATVLVHTLSTIAQSAICINHLNYIIITAVSLSFPDINTVPLDTSAKETPFRSTGPGPPLCSRRSDKRKHTPSCSQFNSIVSTHRKSKVNANAERNAAETETQENPRKVFAESKICPPNLVT